MAVCTALGCHHDATVEIEQPSGRTRLVCDDHATDGEVIRDV